MVTASAPSAARRASGVTGTAEAGEYLAALWQVPLAQRAAGDQRLRGRRSTAEHLEAAADEQLRLLRIGERDEARIWLKVARRPFPHVTEQLVAAEVAHAPRVGPDRGRRERPLVEIGELGRGCDVAPRVAMRGTGLQVPRRSLLPL